MSNNPNASDPDTARKPRTPRRMARPAQPTSAAQEPAKAPTKLDLVEAMLRRAEGASIAEIMAATGWQQHSVRGAMAGALKKRGLAITSDKLGGVRRYLAAPAEVSA